MAFWQIKDLSARQMEVYMAISELGTATNLDIADRLKRPINTITPRTNELVERGVVKEDHRAPSKQTGRTAIYWTAA